MPHFHFHLNEKPITRDLGNWVRIYAAAMRCSLRDCDDGFVFLSWSTDTPATRWGFLRVTERWHTQTVLYFDIPARRQVFLDPSHWTSDPTVDALRYFDTHHVWEPPGEASLSVVDLNPAEVSGFCPDHLQTAFTHADNVDLSSHCTTTITFLVVLMCLRFGCKDPQAMADAIRHIVRGRVVERERFLLHLRELENGMVDVGSVADARRWLLPTGPYCHHIMSRPLDTPVRVCTAERSEHGWWCPAHTPLTPPSTRPQPPPKRVIAHALPEYLPFTTVHAVGYFEERWLKTDNGWPCALQTLDAQLRDVPDVPPIETISVIRVLFDPEDEADLLSRVQTVVGRMLPWVRERWDQFLRTGGLLMQLIHREQPVCIFGFGNSTGLKFVDLGYP